MGQERLAEFGRVSKANIAEYIKGAKDETILSRPLLALLEKKGRITYGHSGEYCEWKVLKGLQDAAVITDGAGIPITRKQPYDKAQLSWFGLEVNDAYTVKEKLMNAGNKTAIIKYVKGLGDYIKKSLRVGIHKGLYLDGETADNVGRMHGIETWFRQSTGTIPTGVVPTVSANMGSNTYAGIRFDAAYKENEYWMPKLVIDDSSANNWAAFTGSDTAEILDRAVIEHMENNDGKTPTCALMPKTWYAAIRQYVISNQTLYVERGGYDNRAADVGFKYIDYAGTPIYMESHWPTQKQGSYGCYLLNLDEVEYKVLGDEFIRVDIEGDIEAGLFTKLVGYHFGTMITTSPRCQTKIVDYT